MQWCANFKVNVRWVKDLKTKNMTLGEYMTNGWEEQEGLV